MATRELLWNPKYFSWDEYLEVYNSFLAGEEPIVRWSLGNNHQPKKGDRVFLRRTGENLQKRGYILSGYLTQDAFEAEHWSNSDSITTYSYIQIDLMTPPNNPLTNEIIRNKIPGLSKAIRRAPSIGSLSESLEQLWIDFHEGTLNNPDKESADSPGINIQANYSLTLQKTRLHQAKFRKLIFDSYPTRCEICGISDPRILDAAHIIPDSQGG